MNTLIELEDNGRNINQTNDSNQVTKDTTNNTYFYENNQRRQHCEFVNLTELTETSDPLNTTLPKLPNVNTPLPRLQRQNSVHFNTEHVVLNNSTAPTITNNQNIQITQQQLVNLVRQLNSQNI